MRPYQPRVFGSIQFSYDGVADNPRVILKGDAEGVLRLLNEYQKWLFDPEKD